VTSVTTETAVAEKGTSERPGLVLAVCCAGQFLVVLDASVMNVALPSIQTALHFRTGSLQWIINAYTIVFAGFLLLGGRLADIYGRRRVFLGGIGVFTLASLAGGLAWNPASLLAARGVQGLGAAIMAPATLTVLGTTFTDRERRARAFGLWGAVAAGGGAIGALVGGAITEWLSWRWILLVNVPVGVLLTAGAAYAVTESRKDDGDRRMDLPGALAITAGLILLVYGIVRSEKEGWGSPQIIVSLGLAVVLLVLFAVNEARRRDRHPLVPLGIFRNRSVTAANLVAFSSTAALWGTFFLFTLLLQLVLGYSPLETGFAYLPLSLGIVVAARGIAPLVPKTGPRPLLVAGLLLSAAGLAWLSRAGADAGFLADLFGPTLVLGIGQGLVSASMTVAGTSEVGYREQGLVSGLLNTSRQVGGALGLGILAVVAAAHTSAVAHGGHATERALAAGFDRALLVSALFPLLGVAAALAVPKVRPDQDRDARG
jgi:EmrB/QacA subfamily drug resistance transporter